MKRAYKEWIMQNVPDDAAAYGHCLSVTKAMAEAFPELTIVYGNYYCPIWGERWHQWLTTIGGEIVDPTVRQFPSVHGTYHARQPEEMPYGKCANCGELYYTPYDDTVCSEACSKAFIRSLYES